MEQEEGGGGRRRGTGRRREKVGERREDMEAIHYINKLNQAPEVTSH